MPRSRLGGGAPWFGNVSKGRVKHKRAREDRKSRCTGVKNRESGIFMIASRRRSRKKSFSHSEKH